jgi:glycosyltransferase involved in cell wall biosynthesis
MQPEKLGPAPGTRLALVHHWLVTRRGGERCLDALASWTPGADLFTLVHDPEACPAPAGLGRIQTTALQRWGWTRDHFRLWLPWFPRLYGSLDLSGYDLVISSDACLAKTVRVPEGCVHVCYCYSPVRYAWDLRELYLQHSVPALARPLARAVLAGVRRADRKAADRVDHFVAISQHVADRIQRCYGRTSVVIHPPTDITFFRPDERELQNHRSGDDSRPYLLLGQAVPYKRFEDAVLACGRLDRPLIVAGGGPDFDRLRTLAGPHTTFKRQPTDVEVRTLYQQCRALIFPGEEDFGLVPVEAMACGRPVIALGKGGATETVIHERTGVLTPAEGPEILLEGILRFETWEPHFDSSTAVARAAEFSLESHRRGMGLFLGALQIPA